MKLDTKLQARLGIMFTAPEGERELSGQLLLVPVERLRTQAQPRQVFEEGPLQDLAASIRELRDAGKGIDGTGILQPLLVRAGRDENEGIIYTVTAGERRLRAAKLAQLPQVPVVVTKSDDDDAWEQAIVENLLRADLAPLEEAEAMQKLMKARGYSVREAAKRLGKDKGYVENRVRLLRMGADVREMVSLRKDAVAHARVIEAVKDPQTRAELIRATVEDLASYPAIRERAEAFTTGTQPETAQDKVSLRKDSTSTLKNDAVAGARTTLEATTRKIKNVARKLPDDGNARSELVRHVEATIAELQQLVTELRG